MDGPTTPLPRPRTLAGRYRLVEPIGRGGMSLVYRAVDELLHREVAVKILDPATPVRDPAAAERFRREARTTASLSHDNIVTVFDTGIDEGHAFLVMELLHQGTLADEVRRRGPLPPEEVRDIGAQVASALEAAHGAGIVHRDIKPGNIARADDGRIKVLDFGITRLVDEAQDTAGPLTAPQAILGTAQYLSPEQARGGAADERSDLYALGCVLFALLVGHPPYQGDSNFATMAMHTSAPLPDLAALRPDAPAELVSLVTGLLAKDPDERPQPAGVVASRLQQPAEAPPTMPLPSEPERTTPPTVVMPGPPPTTARRSAAPWVLGGVALVAAGLAGYALLAGEEPTAGTAPSATPSAVATADETTASEEASPVETASAEEPTTSPATDPPEEAPQAEPDPAAAREAAGALSDAVKEAFQADEISNDDRKRVDEGLRELDKALKEEDDQRASDALSAMDQALSDSGRKEQFEGLYDGLKDAVDEWKGTLG